MERTLRKTRVGLVTSNKMDKTIVVSVVEKYKHPLYKKTVSEFINAYISVWIQYRNTYINI